MILGFNPVCFDGISKRKLQTHDLLAGKTLLSHDENNKNLRV